MVNRPVLETIYIYTIPCSYHMPSLQYPEEVKVHITLIKSTSVLFHLPKIRVERDSLSRVEVLQVRPLQFGHPLECAWREKHFDKLCECSNFWS